MSIKAGANKMDQKKIAKFARQGASAREISKALKIELGVIEGYLEEGESASKNESLGSEKPDKPGKFN